MSNSKSNSKNADVQAQEVELTGIEISRDAFMRDYAMITNPAQCKVLVASTSKAIPVLNGEGEEVFDRTDGRQLFKHIVNLKAIPRQHVKAVQEAWKGKEKLDLAYLRGKTLSVNAIIPASGELDLPFNGQEIPVKTDFLVDSESGDYATNDDGDKILVVTAYKFPSVASAERFSFDAEIELPELEEEAA